MKTIARQCVRNPLHHQGFIGVLLITLITLGTWLVFSGSGQMEGARAAESGHREVTRIARDRVSRSSIPRAFGRIPLSFTVNQGQTDPRVKFLSQGAGYKLLLSSAEAVLTLSPPAIPHSAASFKMKLVAGNRKAVVEGFEELPGKSNYFIGNDPKKWRTNVPTYARVQYRDIYPGVDLVYYGNQEQLEYDLLVAPRADPGVIKLSFEGAEKLELAANGDLLVSAAGTELRQLKPVVFQEVDDESRKPVECRYVLRGRREIGFALGAYDTDKQLVIDPLLVYSTTSIGGDSIAVDSAGNVYLTGSSLSPDYPGTSQGAFQTTHGGSADTFVAKLNASGTALLYATFLGGSGNDLGHDLEVDSARNVYIVGGTTSPNFPVSAGSTQSKFGGGEDVFITKLNGSGSALIYSTFLGGADVEAGNGIEADSAGNAYITGGTISSDFPVTEGAFQTTHAGNTDAFVTKVNPIGTDIIYSTYLGTSGWEGAADIALDASGEVYIAGTSGYGFPTTPGAFTTPTGIHFVTKLNASGTVLVYSSLFSTSIFAEFGFDSVRSIATDAAGNVYVSGTFTKEVPGTAYTAPFVLKLNPTGSALVYSVSFGGPGDAGRISVDPFGNAYITGWTSGNLAVTADAIQKEIGGGTDAFIAKLSPSGTLLYSTYLGGNILDYGTSVAIDSTGGILVTGVTASTNFLTTPDSYRSTAGVGTFVVKFAPEVSSVSAAHFNISPIAKSAIVAAFGLNLATETQPAFSTPLPTSLAGTQLLIKDSVGIDHPAPLFYVSPTQINYQVPAGAALGPALITVKSSDGRTSTGLMTITSVAPALFTLNQSGSGAAAALDGFTFTGAPFAATRPDGQPNIIALFGTGLGADATDLDTSADVSSSVEVTIDGIPATTLFAGSAPGFTGLNQFNVVLPIGIGSGNHTLGVARNGVKSNLVTIAIK